MPADPPYTVGNLDEDYRDPDLYGSEEPEADEDAPDDHPRPGRRRPTHIATGLPAPTPDDADEEDESDLSAIVAELDAEGPPLTVLPIPARRGWEAAYSIDVRSAQLESWRKRSKTRRGVDNAKFSAIALAELNVRLIRNGRVITLEGEEQTFTSRPFMDSLGVTRAADAVRKVYQLEGTMDAALRGVLREAGWGEDLEAYDEEE